MSLSFTASHSLPWRFTSPVNCVSSSNLRNLSPVTISTCLESKHMLVEVPSPAGQRCRVHWVGMTTCFPSVGIVVGHTYVRFQAFLWSFPDFNDLFLSDGEKDKTGKRRKEGAVGEEVDRIGKKDRKSSKSLGQMAYWVFGHKHEIQRLL